MEKNYKNILHSLKNMLKSPFYRIISPFINTNECNFVTFCLNSNEKFNIKRMYG